MYCSHCGKQFTPDANFCPTCGAASTHQGFAPNGPMTRIVRPRHPRLIAGVCSGFALHYGWDVAITRVVFAVLTLLTAFWLGVILYIVGWVVLPDAQYTLPPATYPAPFGVPPRVTDWYHKQWNQRDSACVVCKILQTNGLRVKYRF